MKKSLLIFILAIVLCFSACSNESTEKDNDKNEEKTTVVENVTNNEKKPENVTNDVVEDATEATQENVNLPLNQNGTEFTFSSGAGGWRTVIRLNSDGTFTGRYSDSEMGSTGEGYPNGSYYISEFSGKFVNIKKVNDYTYSMELADLKFAKTVGEEWIEDEILYIASEPYGLESGKEFIFYLPETPITAMNEEFQSWWPGRFDFDAPKSTMSCYGILNVETNYGFFTY